MFSKVKCPNCGAKNPKERMICVECGSSLVSGQAKSKVTEVPKEVGPNAVGTKEPFQRQKEELRKETKDKSVAGKFALLRKMFSEEPPLEAAKKFVHQGEPERAVIVLQWAAAKDQLDEEGWDLLKKSKELQAEKEERKIINQKDPFSHERYLFFREPFTPFGDEFRIYDSDENQVLYSKQKTFKLKKDIRVYSDDSTTNELLTIKAREVLGFSATYDVIDTRTGILIGALYRKRLTLARPEWILLDPQGLETGKIQENLLVLLARKYTISIREQTVASLEQHFELPLSTYILDLSEDYEKRLDQRLAIAAGILILSTEHQR